MKTSSDHESELIDPDPFSIIILALGAAGSIASIVGYAEMKYAEHRERREARDFELRDALMGTETALNELRALVRSLEIAFLAGTHRPNSIQRPGEMLASFGRARETFTRDGYERWQEIEESILATTGRLHRHVTHLLRLFATTEVRLSSQVASHLASAVERMNRLTGRLTQIHFQDLFAEMEELVGECGNVMREVREECLFRR